MSSLKMHEKEILRRLFDRGGYVLDFNDRTFAEFFRENGINIEEQKYHCNGRSKMKRLRAFWEIESDRIVGEALNNLLKYAYTIENNQPDNKIQDSDKMKATKIINRLLGKSQEQDIEQIEKDNFLKKEFKDISLYKLKLDSSITDILQQRIDEIKKCLSSKSALATIFLCGSTLEGVLLGVATQNIQIFNSANASPKDKNKVILPIERWTLNHLINVAQDTGFLEEDVRKFSHALRDFRNYIHPYEQASKGFKPNEHTAKICFQVLKVAIHQLVNKQNEYKGV